MKTTGLFIKKQKKVSRIWAACVCSQPKRRDFKISTQKIIHEKEDERHKVLCDLYNTQTFHSVHFKQSTRNIFFSLYV